VSESALGPNLIRRSTPDRLRFLAGQLMDNPHATVPLSVAISLQTMAEEMEGGPASRHLLGQRVRIKLDENVIVTGKLLGFGDGGTFEIEEDDGFVHHCWPMLEVELDN
jgi:hypothetical protein